MSAYTQHNMIDGKYLEELFKTANVFNEFLLTITNPKTYLKEITDQEFEEFYKNTGEMILELNRAYWGFLFELSAALAKRDSEEVFKAVGNAMERFEEIYAKYMNNAVVSALINSVNSAYMRSLLNLQNFTSAMLHTFGMVSRRDVIALSEAYVDLKGDIKKESRKILEEVRALKEKIEKMEKSKGGGSDAQ